MKNLQLGKDSLILAILTLITAITWIGFDVYKASTRTTIPKATKEQMKKLNPTIDTEVIENIKSRKSFSEEELNNTPINQLKIEDQATQSGQEQE
jgi:hypothetical protein